MKTSKRPLVEIVDLVSDSEEEDNVIVLGKSMARLEARNKTDSSATDTEDPEDTSDTESELPTGGEDNCIDDFEGFLTVDEEYEAQTGRRFLEDQETKFQESEAEIPFNCTTLEEYQIPDGLLLKPEIFVQLCDKASLDMRCEECLGDFLRIKVILYDHSTDEITVKGIRYRRAYFLHGMLGRKMNEVYECRRFNEQDGRSILNQSLDSFPPEFLILGRELIRTNAPYPTHRWEESEYETKDDVTERARLVCRFAYTTVSNHATAQRSRRNVEVRLERLARSEVDPEYAVSDQALRTSARMAKTAKFSDDFANRNYKAAMRHVKAMDIKPGENVIDLNPPEVIVLDDDTEESALSPDSLQASKTTAKRGTGYGQNDPYTFVDSFAGAGGVSYGALLAGLILLWAFDKWKDACRTLTANFRGLSVYQEEAYDIITRVIRDGVVDVLHVSLPCCFVSANKTSAGKHDDENRAALFSLGPLVEKYRPRVVTLEEVSGLLTHHPVFLNMIILQLTTLGYSARWKIINCAEFGNFQARKRLILIASCPGEPLPPFPKATHGPGLKRFTTIHDALRTIPVHPYDRVMDDTIRRDEPSYDAGTPLKRCITTDGGKGNFHPSGKRTFSNRELAALQGFPPGYKFYGEKTSVRKQIGNAVPSMVMKTIFETIVATLRATDAAEAAADRAGEIEASKGEIAEDGEDEWVNIEEVADASGGKDVIMLD